MGRDDLLRCVRTRQQWLQNVQSLKTQFTKMEFGDCWECVGIFASAAASPVLMSLLSKESARWLYWESMNLSLLPVAQEAVGWVGRTSQASPFLFSVGCTSSG